jgi:type II secretory ATPase GspE/PulE/Tfp pilus assembly ATPase PilB-like protein/ActR/RegA family two-component response regulator
MLEPRRNWLVDVAVRAGLVGARDSVVEVGAPTPEAWTAVARACGVAEPDLTIRVAAHYRTAVADLEAAEKQAQSFLPEKVARRYLAFPLRATERQLVVAVADPTDLDAEQALGFASGRTIAWEIASPAMIQEAIDTRYAPDRVVERLIDRIGAKLVDDVRIVEDAVPQAVSSHEVDSTPVVKLTNLILHDGVSEGASDIHLEPGRDGGTVRFRVDGVLRPFMQLPLQALNRVVSRIKIMGKLDIADRLRPQDGRARVEVAKRTFDLRISTVPTREAEKAVIRILDPTSTRSLEHLGVPGPELTRLRRLMSYRDGVVVVTGPTGSGKTTLMYAVLAELATGQINIMTVEDPVEYDLPGMTQIQVETKRGVTFASALRSILRQDPDVVFVGEIRDLETAEVAIQASLTGHLVLATLHANDAVGAVARFTDIGVDRSKIATTLRGAVAQRLARRVCPHCAQRIEGPLAPEEVRLAARYGAQPLVRAVGCARCGKTGYRGRLPLLEVLFSDASVEGLITEGAPASQVQKAAVSGGMRPLRDVAAERVRHGDTTLQEIDRVLGEVGGEEAPPASVPHVLLVDDDPVARALARSLLEKNGFRVSEAGDGTAALELLKGSPDFALMVLDVEMPRMGGREVLARVRKSVHTAGLPVLVLTGSSSDEAEAQLMEEGADDYINKPFEPARFVARVKAALRRAGA